MLGVEKEIQVNFTYEGKGENEEGKDIIIFQGEFTLRQNGAWNGRNDRNWQ